MSRAIATAALVLFAASATAGCGAAAVRPRLARDTTASDTPPAVHVSAKVRAQEVAMHRQVSAALRSGAASGARYGSLPRALRDRQDAPPDQVLSATAGHPAQPITGVAARVHLAGGSALALAVGPYVPLRDQGSFHNHTPATWRVTFSAVRGSLPLRASMFTITDEQGQVLRPRVTVLGGGRLPALAPARRSLTVVLAARTSIGSGTLAYTPTGNHFIVGWQFDAETD